MSNVASRNVFVLFFDTSDLEFLLRTLPRSSKRFNEKIETRLLEISLEAQPFDDVQFTSGFGALRKSFETRLGLSQQAAVIFLFLFKCDLVTMSNK